MASFPCSNTSHGGSRRWTTSSFSGGSCHNVSEGALGPPLAADLHRKRRPCRSRALLWWLAPSVPVAGPLAVAGPTFQWFLPRRPHLRKKQGEWGVKEGEAEGDGRDRGRGRRGDGGAALPPVVSPVVLHPTMTRPPPGPPPNFKEQ